MWSKMVGEKENIHNVFDGLDKSFGWQFGVVPLEAGV